MRRLLSAAWFIIFCVAAWLIYDATGGLRVELVEVGLTQPPLPAEESLELTLFYQNAPRPLSIQGVWTTPDGGTQTRALELEPGDGGLTLTLTGEVIPAGEHTLDMLWNDEALSLESFQVPPREIDYSFELDYAAGSLEAVFNYRHAATGAMLSAEWRHDGALIPDTSKRVPLTDEVGSADFRLDPASPDDPLPSGEYRLVLEYDGAYLDERSITLRR